MEEVKTIAEQYTLSAFQVALISAGVSVLTFLITNWLKNYFENKLLQRNLETEPPLPSDFIACFYKSHTKQLPGSGVWKDL